MRGIHILLILSLLFGQFHAAFHTETAPVIEIAENKFFKSSDKTQFFIRGVAYQRPTQLHISGQKYIDSLALTSLCLKDLKYFKELGINTVRVYGIDPAEDHDVCMSAFAAHGIYVFVDLPEPNLSIDGNYPLWDTDLLERYTAVVDSMHGYTNVIGFIAGDNVVTSPDNSKAAAFVKSSIRDTKNHMVLKGYRRIPVGYTSKDNSALRLNSVNYFVCTENETESSAVDFYALNIYSWCGYSSFSASRYQERTTEFALMPVPVFFSEYGCNTYSPRPFTEIELIYGPQMTEVWSGGLVYEFFQKLDKFGLVQESASGKITKLADFNIVKLRLVENVPQGTLQTRSKSTSTLPLPCPNVSPTWRSLSILPPTPDEGMCECLLTTLSCIFSPNQKVDERAFLLEMCSKTDCSDVMSNSTSGTYGKYSGCGLRQKLSYVLTKYWLENNRNPELCDFNKRAVLISNTAFTDLNNLRAPDGRTCREALGGSEFKEYIGGGRKNQPRSDMSSVHAMGIKARSNDSGRNAGYIKLLGFGSLILYFILSI